jgi:translocation and assembly module TamB
MKVQSSRRSWKRRWLLRALGLCVVLASLALVGGLVLLHSLDRAWVKQRLAALALARSGLEISYGKVEVRTWSDLEIRDLVVRSPAAVRAVAPELLRIGHLRVVWWHVPPFGWRPALREIDIDGLRLVVAVDENGKTSFDALPSSGAPEPATPRSQLAGNLLGTGFLVPKISVSGIVLTLIQSDHGVAVEQDTARGLSFAVSATPELRGARLHLTVGDANTALELSLERSRVGANDSSAAVRAFLVLDASASDASAVVDLRLRRQNLMPEETIERLLHLEASAKFEPAASRVRLAVSRLSIADDTATTETALELPDRGAPIVRHSAGDVDLASLLRLAAPWAPAPQLAGGRLHYGLDDLALDRPLATTVITVEGELSGLRVPFATGSLALKNARLSLHARPSGATVNVEGSLGLDGLLVESGGRVVRGEGISLTLGGQRADSGAITGHADLRFAALSSAGQSLVAARDGHIALSARDVRADLRSPLSATGNLSLDAELTTLEVGTALRFGISNLTFHADTPLAVGARWALSSGLRAEHVRVARANRTLADLPVQLVLAVKDLSPDLQRPESSAGAVHVAFQAGGLEATLDATKRDDALDYALRARAAELAAVRLFVPEGPARDVPWEQMALELDAKGHATHVTSSAPELEQRSTLRLTGAALETVATRALTLDLHSHGGAIRHDADLDLGVEGLRVADTPLGDEHLKASLELDRSRPSLQITLAMNRLAKAELRASATFDREQQAVSYEASGQLSRLSPLAPLLSRVRALAGLDLSNLALRLKSHGSLKGVISGVRANGTLIPALEPLRSGHASAAVELAATELHWADGDRALGSPALTLRASLDGDARVRTVHSDLVADEIDFGLGRHRLRATGLHDQSELTEAGSFFAPTLQLEQHSTIDAVEQNFAPSYTVADVQAHVRVHRDPDGLIKVDDIQLENRAAGTALHVQGGIDLGDDLRRLSLRATVNQDLARASNRHELFTGSGTARMSLSVESPDFRVFHSKATLQLENAHAHFPGAKVALDGIDGDVPIALDLTYGKRGVELLRGVQINPYATLRFADQHPLLKSRSFISIASVTTPLVSVAPFAANLKLDQNIVSLSQLEMGVRGGSITGDGVFDWNGAQSTFQADVRASGVMSSHGEPFDGNAALSVDIGDRSVEGRADILRIGRRHLQDLLDLQDPQHINSGMNHIRTALIFGYPERVRIELRHGFASAGVSFGGLAGLVSVDDVRGIPIGPLMERVVSSFDAEAEQ